MEVNLKTLLDKYQTQKNILLRELYHLNYSAREVEMLLGGANKDSVYKIIEGDIPTLYTPYSLKEKRPEKIEKHVGKLFDDYWQTKVLVVKELHFIGLKPRSISNLLGPSNRTTINQIFTGWGDPK